MPYKAKRACMFPGCQATYDGKGAYCAEHAKAKINQAARDYAANGRDKDRQTFEMSARWKAIRRMKLRIDPLCEDCLKSGNSSYVKQAELVHHIDNDFRHNELDNLCSLCRVCHNKRTEDHAR